MAHPEPFTTELYNETKTFLKKHVLCLRDELDNHENNSTLLKVYYDVWTKYSQGIGFLNQLYWWVHAFASSPGQGDLNFNNTPNFIGT